MGKYSKQKLVWYATSKGFFVKSGFYQNGLENGPKDFALQSNGIFYIYLSNEPFFPTFSTKLILGISGFLKFKPIIVSQNKFFFFILEGGGGSIV